MAALSAKLQHAIEHRQARELAHLDDVKRARELASNRAIAAAAARHADKVASDATAPAAQRGA